MKIFKLNLSLIAIVALILLSTISYAQNTIYSQDNLGTFFDLKEKKYNKKLLGNNYVSDEWQLADIVLIGDTVEFRNIEIKLDVSNRVIEIKAGDQTKLLSSTQAKTITVKGYTPTFYVTRVGTGLYGPSGFYKVLYEGDEKLLCHYSTRIEPSHYNEALNAGQKDDKIIKVETFYISKLDKLVPLELKKSKLADQLGGGESLLKYMKEEGLSPKKEIDLIKIVQYADKLNASN
ncbi:MAG: hypothetical protein R2728_03425 [Chitinophagales bacterium]